MIDLIEQMPQSSAADATEIRCIGREHIIRHYKKELDKVSDLEENGWKHSRRDYIRDVITRIDQVPDEYEIILINISHHDTALQDILINEQKAGNLTVVSTIEGMGFE